MSLFEEAAGCECQSGGVLLPSGAHVSSWSAGADGKIKEIKHGRMNQSGLCGFQFKRFSLGLGLMSSPWSVTNSNDSGVLSGRGGTGDGGLPGRKTGSTPFHQLMLWFEYLLYCVATKVILLSGLKLMVHLNFFLSYSGLFFAHLPNSWQPQQQHGLALSPVIFHRSHLGGQGTFTRGTNNVTQNVIVLYDYKSCKIYTEQTGERFHEYSRLWLHWGPTCICSEDVGFRSSLG